MSRYIKEETELNVLDLLHYYTKHSISIIIVAVLFAGLISGYMVIKNRNTNHISSNSEETEMSTERNALFDLSDKEQQQQNVENYLTEKSALQNTVNSLQEQIRKQNAYLANSVLMNLDPYHVVTSRVDIRVWAMEDGEIQQMNTLLLYYKQLLNNGRYLSELAKELGMDSAYLRELISVTSAIPDYLEDIFQGGMTATDEDLLASHIAQGSYGYLYITVRGNAAEWTEKVREDILSYLYSLEDEKPFGITQKLEEVDRFTVTSTDMEVRNVQANSNQYNITLYNQLNTINTTMSNLNKPEDVVSESTVVFSRNDLLKYIIFGGTVGILFMILFLGYKYLFDDSVSTYERISQKFNLNHLGSFMASDNTHRLAETPTLEMICANVRIYSDEKDRILLAGCVNEALLNGIGKILSEHFLNQNFIIGGNITEDPEARKKLSDCDAVILLEERKVSKHSVIHKELEILEPLDVKLLGVIVA